MRLANITLYHHYITLYILIILPVGNFLREEGKPAVRTIHPKAIHQTKLSTALPTKLSSSCSPNKTNDEMRVHHIAIYKNHQDAVFTTNVSGIHGPWISEFVLGFMSMHTMRTPPPHSLQ
jgi:hypothetical protein